MTGDDLPMRSRMQSRGSEIVLVAARELRLLLGLMLVLFVTSETWRFIGRLPLPRLLPLLAVVLGTSILVAVVGVRRVLSGLDPTTARRAATRVALEVVAFGGALLGGFTALGAGTMDVPLVAEWTGVPVSAVTSIGLGDAVVVTRALAQVAAFLAVLGALAFAVEAVLDPDTRATLLADLLDAPQEEVDLSP